MKKLTIEQKARAYDEALETARKINSGEGVPAPSGWTVCEVIFPELKESEDEKIRKALIRYFTLSDEHAYNEACGVSYRDIVAWLEKQGEKKSVDKVEPKFHKGDWVVFNGLILRIDEIVDGYYRTTSIGGIPNSYDWNIDNAARLWTIQDAKDGDVLVIEKTDTTYECIFIFNKIESNRIIQYLHYFTTDKGEEVCEARTNCGFLGFVGNNVHPATKEQRDLLFQKMKEAGYEWDAEKKELKKIEEKPDWTEEDEAKLKSILFHIEDVENKDVIVWLKSLKDRVQSQNRWKESLATADLENSLCDIQNAFSDTSYEYRILGEAIEFIRCTEPKPQWKPSEEQMKILKEVCDEYWEPDGLHPLYTLYQDLKKLKE